MSSAVNATNTITGGNYLRNPYAASSYSHLNSAAAGKKVPQNDTERNKWYTTRTVRAVKLVYLEKIHTVIVSLNRATLHTSHRIKLVFKEYL